MVRTTTLEDLKGENAYVIVGTIARLLGQLERKVDLPELKGLKKRYTDEAMSGDYRKLCEVSEDYALKYLQSSLQAKEGDLTALHEEELLWHDEN